MGTTGDSNDYFGLNNLRMMRLSVHIHSLDYESETSDSIYLFLLKWDDAE